MLFVISRAESRAGAPSKSFTLYEEMIVRAPSKTRSLRFEWETTNPGHLFLVSAGIRAENSQPNLTTSLNESPTPYGSMRD
jgi:hypothetical protein